MGAPSKRTSANLDRSAYIPLSRISMQGPMSIGQPSEAFGLNASTLNRQTSSMTQAESRIADRGRGGRNGPQVPRHRRARRMEEARAELAAGFEKILAEWTPQEVVDFAAFPRRFNTGIERLDGLPWPAPDSPPGRLDTTAPPARPHGAGRRTPPTAPATAPHGSSSHGRRAPWRP
jgi:hypothetical protein